MDELIRKQLESVKVASLDDYDADTMTYHIRKYEKLTFTLGECYIIRIDDSLLREGCEDVIVNNWNKGSRPPCRDMKVQVEKKMGHMVFVSGVAVNEPAMWEGWLPDNKMTIVSKL